AGGGTYHRRDLSDQLVHHRLARGFLKGAGVRRFRHGLSGARPCRAGDPGAERPVAEETGEMKLRNLWNLGIKELRGLWREPVMLLLIVYSFSLSIYTESKAMPETLADAAIAIVDEDQSALSGRIISAFAPPYFLTPRLIS